MIARFKIAAKLTHKMYGINKYAAGFDTLYEDIIVDKIAIHSRMISMNAAKGFFKPKNKIDQTAFKTSWNENIFIADLAFFIQRRYNAIPTKMNKVIQTGEKIQLGGLNDGLFKDSYQVGIFDTVKNEPMIPANWQSIIEMISFFQLFGCIVLLSRNLKVYNSFARKNIYI